MSAFDGVNGTFCDAQSQQSFAIGGNSSILTNGQSIGLAVSVLSSTIRLKLNHTQLIVEASFLSFGAIIVIFSLIVVCSTSFQPCLSV
jgi:hypothetical protein